MKHITVTCSLSTCQQKTFSYTWINFISYHLTMLRRQPLNSCLDYTLPGFKTEINVYIITTVNGVQSMQYNNTIFNISLTSKTWLSVSRNGPICNRKEITCIHVYIKQTKHYSCGYFLQFESINETETVSCKFFLNFESNNMPITHIMSYIRKQLSQVFLRGFYTSNISFQNAQNW